MAWLLLFELVSKLWSSFSSFIMFKLDLASCAETIKEFLLFKFALDLSTCTLSLLFKLGWVMSVWELLSTSVFKI